VAQLRVSVGRSACSRVARALAELGRGGPRECVLGLRSLDYSQELRASAQLRFGGFGPGAEVSPKRRRQRSRSMRKPLWRSVARAAQTPIRRRRLSPSGTTRLVDRRVALPLCAALDAKAGVGKAFHMRHRRRSGGEPEDLQGFGHADSLCGAGGRQAWRRAFLYDGIVRKRRGVGMLHVRADSAGGSKSQPAGHHRSDRESRAGRVRRPGR
jgi:hypothetical protein